MDPSTNVILIGMCGVGKSTVGVLLAKALNRDFIDSDLCLQRQFHMPLPRIIEHTGVESFCRIEEHCLLDLAQKTTGTVIATGGSAVYSDLAMAHLGRTGPLVHLDLDFETIQRRVQDPHARGVAIEPGETLQSLYDKRLPLYRKYAVITVPCVHKTHDEVVSTILAKLPE